MTINHSAYYKPYFDVWQSKLHGSKPTNEMFEAVHGLGLAPGKQAMACAMSLRPEGTTGPQIVLVCGKPQLNRMRGLIKGGMFKQHVVANDALNHVVYKCEVSAAGKAEIKRIAAAKANAQASTAAPKAAIKAKPKAQPVATAKAPVAVPKAAVTGKGAPKQVATP